MMQFLTQDHKLIRAATDTIILKGRNKGKDCYSGFGSSAEDTGLLQGLRSLGVKSIFIVGFCTEYCCASTAQDGVKHGFEVYLVEDGCGTLSEETGRKTIADLRGAGVNVVSSNDLLM
uniref:nicotinamidase n=1 Tax=Nephromyces sp. MMRI TaxID=2496275 RepID=A0A3S5HLX3_9APIC|nr:peroxisomal adenine nucleotide carrier 1 [Nephromyces sp. MMRI]